MLFYLDTARMGQACPAAMQVQFEYALLAADDPSLYSLRFLREGVADWPLDVQHEFPALCRWRGTDELKQRFAMACGVPHSNRIFLANQAARLVRIAARVMFRQSTHVLTTDLNWPTWQSIVAEEAQRHGRQVSRAMIAEPILKWNWSAEDIIQHVVRQFREQRCDALFLPAVSNLGINLPVEELIRRLKQEAELRFVLLDAAQAFGQLPVTRLTDCCDVVITGCHKWLGAHLPMGVAIAGNALAAEQMRCVITGPHYSSSCTDPLLQLTEELQANRINRYSETVNILPMLSANAALQDSQGWQAALTPDFDQRQLNAEQVAECLADTAWRPIRLDESVRSGILLARSEEGSPVVVEPEKMQANFRKQGVALTAYPDGLLRLSMPSQKFESNQIQRLTTALRSAGQSLRP